MAKKDETEPLLVDSLANKPEELGNVTKEVKKPSKDAFDKPADKLSDTTEKFKGKLPGEPIQQSKKTTEKPIESVNYVYWRCPGVDNCPVCGSKKLTNTDGSLRCAINDKNCVFIK